MAGQKNIAYIFYCKCLKCFFIQQFRTFKIKKPIGFRVSTNIGHTVNFTKCTGHLKCVILEFFSLSEHNKNTKLHSQCRKIEVALLNCMI